MALRLKIIDIDINISINDFEDKIKNFIASYSEPMTYQIKSVRTRHGKNMQKIIVDNVNNSTFEMVAEQDDVTGDLKFFPIKLSNMNGTFYKDSYQNDDIIGKDEDPAVFVRCFFIDLVKQTKGKFAIIDSDGYPLLYVNGSYKNVDSLDLAIIEKDGTVYSSYGAKNIGGTTSESVNFSVNKPIAEWLNEHTELKDLLRGKKVDEQMNTIGKFLIQEKIQGNIDSDEFQDIFCQAGIIGYSDSTVLNIYNLLM